MRQGDGLAIGGARDRVRVSHRDQQRQGEERDAEQDPQSRRNSRASSGPASRIGSSGGGSQAYRAPGAAARGSCLRAVTVSATKRKVGEGARWPCS
jgi:hypothetical protein